METTSISNSKHQVSAGQRPRIYDYIDYRSYLADMARYQKELRPSFSLAVFAKKAGLQTRNYLKRVIDGDRNLSQEYVPKFCQGFELTRRESLFFDALVNYNQAKTEDIKKHYFSLLCAAAEGEPKTVIEIIQDQFEIFNGWHAMTMRELVLLKDFDESPAYLSKKLKGKVSPKDAKHMLDVLVKTGLLKRDEVTRRLVQTSPIARYNQDIINMQVRNYHQKNIDRAKEALAEDPIETWNVRALSLAANATVGAEIQEKINAFFDEINHRYSVTSTKQSTCDRVIQMNIQMFEVTESENESKKLDKGE